MAQNNPTEAKEVAAQPWKVVAADATLDAFLRGLAGGANPVVSPSDLASVREELALWAVNIPSTDLSAGSSAYFVSSETYKRIKASRLT